jgi:coenzyme F420-0:L-glutamate ligase/coenzyme F420-1:gamma-L-glutamate ligase
VADEVAGAADLVLGKAALTPAAVVRGLGHLVLPTGRHGPGAAALVRADDQDLFGLGAGDAVLAAVRRDAADAAGFPAGAGDVASRLPDLVARASEPFGDRLRVTTDPGNGTVAAEGDALAAGALGERLRVLGWAGGCTVHQLPGAATTWVLRLRP